MEGTNTTRYPLVLVHGMGIRDRVRFNAWGRVPKALGRLGYRVYHGGQDANGTIADNAAVLKAAVLAVLQETGSDKVNLFAHSKGGLDARYMITHLGMGDKVASLTTFSSPHHGSKTMDFLLKYLGLPIRLGCWVTDGIMRLGGDQHPKTYRVLEGFTTAAAEQFNRTTPDDGRVYYQSYSFVMKRWYSDWLMVVPYLVVHAIEGPNDGLLTPAATCWGQHQGIFTGNGRRGVSQWDQVDVRRRRIEVDDGRQIGDMVAFYTGVAEELSCKGY